MSEVKTNEPVKQEGDFKIKSKPKKPKQLGNKDHQNPKAISFSNSDVRSGIFDRR